MLDIQQKEIVCENRTPISETEISSQATRLWHGVNLTSCSLDFARSLRKKSVFSKDV